MSAEFLESPPVPPAQAGLEQLRIERRSYIIGTLVIWGVVLGTLLILLHNMEPQLFLQDHATTVSAAFQRIAQAPPLNPQQQLVLDIVMLVGGLALLFLNWRFSFLLRRPRGAFSGGPNSVGRWLWWGLLAFNSMFFASFLFPQLLVTLVMAHWGKQEMAARRAAPPPAPPPL